MFGKVSKSVGKNRDENLRCVFLGNIALSYSCILFGVSIEIRIVFLSVFSCW